MLYIATGYFGISLTVAESERSLGNFTRISGTLFAGLVGIALLFGGMVGFGATAFRVAGAPRPALASFGLNSMLFLVAFGIAIVVMDVDPHGAIGFLTFPIMGALLALRAGFSNDD